MHPVQFQKITMISQADLERRASAYQAIRAARQSNPRPSVWISIKGLIRQALASLKDRFGRITSQRGQAQA